MPQKSIIEFSLLRLCIIAAMLFASRKLCNGKNSTFALTSAWDGELSSTGLGSTGLGSTGLSSTAKRRKVFKDLV